MTRNPRESDRIEADLRRMILSLELEPGAPVSEAALMQRYGWGRTPLREACQRLAEQSLLEILPRQGVVVSALSILDFVELMDAMSTVIGPAAALACKRLDEATLAQLDEIISHAESAWQQNDILLAANLDFEFHALLAEATGNRYLRAFLLRLHQSALRFNLAAWKRDGQATSSLSEHRRILQALRARDPVASKAAMLEHIGAARRRMLAPGMEMDE